MNIQTFPVELLIPYARNSKKHPKEQIEKIAVQISQVGFLVPIVVDKDMVIVSGHGRLEAAKSLNLAQVPVLVADHLTEEQAMAFRIADNKVAESEWDLPMLAFELGTLERMNIDLTLTGYGLEEAKSILASYAGADPRDPAPEKDGATEQSEDDFKEFAHQCPKCSFEFD